MLTCLLVISSMFRHIVELMWCVSDITKIKSADWLRQGEEHADLFIPILKQVFREKEIYVSYWIQAHSWLSSVIREIQLQPSSKLIACLGFLVSGPSPVLGPSPLRSTALYLPDPRPIWLIALRNKKTSYCPARIWILALFGRLHQVATSFQKNTCPEEEGPQEVAQFQSSKEIPESMVPEPAGEQTFGAMRYNKEPWKQLERKQCQFRLFQTYE